MGYGIGRDEVMQWDAGVCHQYFMLNDKMRKLAADGYSHQKGMRRGYYVTHMMNFLCTCNSVQADIREAPDSELARLLRVINPGIKLDLKPCKFYDPNTGTCMNSVECRRVHLGITTQTQKGARRQTRYGDHQEEEEYGAYDAEEDDDEGSSWSNAARAWGWRS